MKTQNKFIIVIIFLFLILVLSYKFAISNTINQRREYLNLLTESDKLENSPALLLQLKRKEKIIDSILAINRLKTITAQNNLLYYMNDFASKNNLVVLNFNEPHVFSNNNQTQNTYKFILSGAYNDLSNFIYTLEKNTIFGEVIHSEFKKIHDVKQKTEYLTLTLMLRTITQ
ncbi:hypothetical protein FJ651_06150 [Paucihalobacter ruber]|uniref:Uncharacterized protein n=1 Tax=Paucihalobacter ruber TaxID=2567861 RepID=A0A506PSA4_9FLAO|nr:hypothetical protein [Paucihalobacter ruber]TPV35100.1 hypothetical protein FJ651_06150 [Paucihalobacter ruber]